MVEKRKTGAACGWEAGLRGGFTQVGAWQRQGWREPEVPQEAGEGQVQKGRR